MKRAQKATLREHDLTPEEWGVMTTLRLGKDACRSSPGDLASDLELSSGAMTSRLDRLEQAGLVRRLPDPEDRRGVVVELTDKGREAWDLAANVQGRREAFFARTLTKPEQKQLNTLLRKLLLSLDMASESASPPTT
jgi:DNA-binding MarR family transcriptional regulator